MRLMPLLIVEPAGLSFRFRMSPFLSGRVVTLLLKVGLFPISRPEG